MSRMIVSTCAWVGLLAPLTFAQEQSPVGRVAGPGSLSQAYAQSLGRAVGRLAAHVEELDARAEGERPQLRGTRATWTDLTVERLRFATPRDAQRHFAHGVDAAGDGPGESAPFLAEVRGDQVLVLRGPWLTSLRAQRLRRLAWSGGLPGPDAPSDGYAWSPRAGDLLVVVPPGASGPTAEAIASAHQAGLAGQGRPGFEVRGDVVRVEQHTETRQDPAQSSWVLTARSPGSWLELHALLAFHLAGERRAAAAAARDAVGWGKALGEAGREQVEHHAAATAGQVVGDAGGEGPAGAAGQRVGAAADASDGGLPAATEGAAGALGRLVGRQAR